MMTIWASIHRHLEQRPIRSIDSSIQFSQDSISSCEATKHGDFVSKFTILWSQAIKHCFLYYATVNIHCTDSSNYPSPETKVFWFILLNISFPPPFLSTWRQAIMGAQPPLSYIHRSALSWTRIYWSMSLG